jgi:hypothetical protein
MIEHEIIEYKCYYPFCMKLYKTEEKLNQHIKKKHSLSNDPEIPEKIYFNCPMENCQKTYTSRYNLKVHMKTYHFEIKEFVCQYLSCSQRFKHKSSLERHIRVSHSFNSSSRNEEPITIGYL